MAHGEYVMLNFSKGPPSPDHECSPFGAWLLGAERIFGMDG